MKLFYCLIALVGLISMGCAQSGVKANPDSYVRNMMRHDSPIIRHR